MPYYVDIGAQRVQEWITATPKLSLLRGASHALKVMTSAATVQQWLRDAGLDGTCVVASEAGEKDGVVVVRADDEASATAAATALASELRCALPRIQWAGWWVQADSYLVAHDLAREGHAGVRRFISYPVPYDLPVLEHCSECRQEAVVAGTERGVDCAVRDRSAEPPRYLMINVKGSWPRGLDFDTFARTGGLAPGEIHRDGAVGRKDSRNHLALVKADGNKIGQVFEQIARHAPHVPTLVSGAVNSLNLATVNAVESAAQAVTEVGAETKGVIPHYVGGDDVLVSVPAVRAWEFASQLAGAFELVRDDWRRLLDADLPHGRNDRIREQLEAVIADASLGIGMVFAHASHPLAQSVHAADRALREAKLYTSGTASAIAWVDLTAEGLAGAIIDGQWRQTIDAWSARAQLSGSTRQFKAEAALFTTDAAARARVGQLIRESVRDPATARDRALQWALANCHDASLRKLIEDDVFDLLPLLSRARWWPAAQRKEN